MKHPTNPIRVTAAVISALGVFALTACANPIEQLVQQGTTSAIENLVEQQTGGKVDINSDGDGGITIETEDGSSIDFGTSSKVPDSWPGLPLPNGNLVSSYATGSEFALTYQSSEADIEKLIASLQGQGFEETSSMDMGELKSRTLENAKHQVTLGWFQEEGDTFTLQYMVFDAS